MSSYAAIITTRTNRQILKYRGKWLYWEKRRVAFIMIYQKEGMKERVIKDNTSENFEDTKGITRTRKSKKNR
jgi:hypothetical protein